MRWARVALWGLFTLFLAAAGYDFLWACGLRGYLFGIDFCPAPVDYRAIATEAQKTEQLQRLIHQAELEVAQLPPCPICRQVTRATPPQFAVIIDGSKSMVEKIDPRDPSGPTRMQAVKREVAPALSRARLPKMTYAQFLGCEAIQAAEMTPTQAARKIAALPEDVNNWDGEGKTAIAATLQRVAATFRPDPDGRYRGAIVLVTDGQENCSGDPVAVAQEIARTKPGIQINVLDLAGVSDDPAEQQTRRALYEQNRQIAQVTGGRVWRQGEDLDIDANVVASIPQQHEVCEQF